MNVTGRITEVGLSQLGIPDVNVYVIGQEWTASTKSDPMGYFLLQGYCLEGLQLKFTRHGFIETRLHVTMVTVNVGVAMVRMTRMGKKGPFIV